MKLKDLEKRFESVSSELAALKQSEKGKMLNKFVTLGLLFILFFFPHITYAGESNPATNDSLCAVLQQSKSKLKKSKANASRFFQVLKGLRQVTSTDQDQNNKDTATHLMMQLTTLFVVLLKN